MIDTFVTEESQDAWLAKPNIGHAISIYSCSFSVNHYTEDLFNHHLIFYPTEMKNAVVKRRAEFFAGRYCAQQSLLSLTGRASIVHIGLCRDPLWPAGVAGSISHSINHAIAATALKINARGIGIDIQDAIDSETYTSIKAQIIFGDELKLIQRYDKASIQLLIFSLIFSVKESFFKAAFPEVGHYFDFSCISVMTIDENDQCIYLKINETLSGDLTQGLVVKAHYKCLPEKKVVTLVTLPP